MLNRSQLSKLTKHFFIAFFAGAFLLQQLHAFSFTTHEEGLKKTSFNQVKPTESCFEHFLIQPPTEPKESAMEMEVAEDDEHASEQESFNHFSQQSFIYDHAFDCIIRSRYLQLTNSVQQHPALPFFILHHSWKNHIA